MNCPGIVPPLTSSTNSKPRAALERLDAQEHLAELAGAAGLLLVPVMAFGLAADGFAIGDARRSRGDFDAVFFACSRSSITRRCRSDSPRSTVSLSSMLCSTRNAGSSSASLCSAVRQLLLLALVRGLHGEAEHRLGEIQRRQVDLVLVVAVVQHGIEMQFLDFRDRGDVAGDRLRDLDVLLALELEQVRRRLKGFLPSSTNSCESLRTVPW